MISNFQIYFNISATLLVLFTNPCFCNGTKKYHQHQPRHIHLSYGYDPTTEIIVTWSTIDNTYASIVEFGISHEVARSKKLICAAIGTSTRFIETGPLKLTQYIHRVTLRNLVPGGTYLYQCGSNLGWSKLFFFRAMRSGTDWVPHLAIFGDLGNTNASSLTRLQSEIQRYDVIVHVGDFAYDMDKNDGLVGDAFMDQIQLIAAFVPYMTVPGNHEQKDNFLQYKNRFNMPGPPEFESQLYSWNMGPIHFIGFSTEFYHFLRYGLKPLYEQYKWLDRDLKEASAPENRTIRPWIITYGHRPMYCSNNNRDDCTNVKALVRVGLPNVNRYGLEDMFMHYGVDLSIWAHEHSYERLWPIYNYQVYNGSYKEPYKNPRALVHVTTGSAGCGCHMQHDYFKVKKPYWSAFRSNDYGYTRLEVLNSTTLNLEQVSENQGGKIIDGFQLIRDNHERYLILPIDKYKPSVF